MSALPRAANWTAAAYLEYERAADTRHEFFDGQVYAMAGASERHNQIAAALHYALYGQLVDRPCQVFQSDMRVQAGDSVFFYPDLVVVCAAARYRDDQRDTLLNPSVIIEVLSPSTEDFDRGRKFWYYRALPSLSDYLLVAQARVQVEHYTRQGADAWVLRDFTSLEDRLALPSIGCALALDEVYRRVDFENAT